MSYSSNKHSKAFNLFTLYLYLCQIVRHNHPQLHIFLIKIIFCGLKKVEKKYWHFVRIIYILVSVVFHFSFSSFFNPNKNDTVTAAEYLKSADDDVGVFILYMCVQPKIKFP